MANNGKEILSLQMVKAKTYVVSLDCSTMDGQDLSYYKLLLGSGDWHLLDSSSSGAYTKFQHRILLRDYGVLLHTPQGSEEPAHNHDYH